MSVRELSPLFSWGFSLRRSKWLVPLFNNNVMTFGNSAVTGPYGWNNNSTTQKRAKSTTAANLEPIVTNPQQTREVHTAVHHDPTPILPPANILNIKKPPSPVQRPSSPVEPITIQETHAKPTPKGSSLEERAAKKKQMLEKYAAMSDGELIDSLQRAELQHHALEDIVSPERAVKIRRMFLASVTEQPDMFNELPFENYNYAAVKGKCCENVVGYVPIPVGLVGPFVIDGKEYHVPMATTEGTLLASTSRGAKAISLSGGANTVLLADGMTRGPVVSMPNAKRSAAMKTWLAEPENYEELRKVFNSTSNYARLQSVKVAIAGRSVYIRFKCATGDAMGMNMISIAVEKSMQFLQEKFPDMEIKAVSGNFCTDKKPSAINWIEGRGKSVVSDAVISKHIVESVLKTNVDSLVELNQSKNLVGSALAGSIGGYNAHSSNIVTAVFLATGQDPAQNVESSNCMTLMEKTENGDLYISVTMPSIEVGTVGGGTGLAAQSTCLNILGVKGAHKTSPGQNAQQLARIVSAMVMAGELSLMSALTTGDLVKAHKIHNRGTK